MKEHRQTFHSRADLLKARSPELDINQRQFCHLLISNLIANWADVASATIPHPNVMPWVTPIVGTGTEDPPTLPRIRKRAADACELLADPDEAERARRFAASLVETRLTHSVTIEDAALSEEHRASAGLGADRPSSPRQNPAPGAGSLHDDAEDEDDAGAWLMPDPTTGTTLSLALLAAADLTNAYHQVQSWNSRAFTRSRDDVARLRSAFPERLAVEEQFLRPARDSVVRLRRRFGDATGGAVLCDFIQAGLDANEIDGAHLFVLSEYCWGELSEDARPGWTDLLWRLYVGQTLKSDHASGLEKSALAGGRGPRPIGLDPTNLVGRLDKSYTELVRESWTATANGQRPVHDAVASLLAAQARYFIWLNQSVGSDELKDDQKRLLGEGAGDITARLEQLPKPPLPLAIVTSLDLDLELALLAKRTPFVVAMPVTVRWKNSLGGRTDAPSWIALHVAATPQGRDPDFDTIRKPSTSTRWISLHTDDLVELRRRTGGLPIVLRLTGCPLIKLPKPPTANGDEQDANRRVFFRSIATDHRLDEDEGEEVTLITHQVLIDEFAGIQQAITSSDGPQLPNLLMPAQGSDVDGRHLARFFLMLGVQFDDPAVRNRLSLELVQTVPATSRWAKRNGLAVIQRVAGAAEDLLATLGFDLVLGASCTSFVTDINHYTSHVLSLEPSHFPPQLDSADRYACPLLSESSS